MDYRDIQKLKVFFQALKDGNFKLNSNQIPSSVRTNCLPLLRKLPQFQTEDFKDDNVLINALNNYLKDPSKRRFFLAEAEFTLQQQEEFTRVLEKPIVVETVGEQPGEQQAGVQEQPPVGEPSSTMAEGMSLPGIGGGAGAASTPRRVIHVVQQAKPPGASETVPGLKTTPETGLDYEGKPYEMDAEYAARKEAETAKTSQSTADAKTGSKFQAPKIPEGVTRAGKSMFSKMGTFFRNNISPKLLARGATSIIGGFLGKGIAGNPGMLAGAGLGAIAPDALKSGWLGNKLGSIGRGGLNFIPNLSGGGIRSRFAKIPKPSASFLKGGRLAALGFGIFFFMAFGLALFGGPSSGGATPTGSTTPPPVSSTSSFGLDYTLPLRDPSIAPLDIKDQVKAAFPNALIGNWDIIVEKSIAAGWNPALLLALWIEESGAQGAPIYDDPLGCQPGVPTTDINISLNCVFNSYAAYTNNQFIEFMTRYGGGTPGQSLAGNANFPKFPDVVKSWYIRLVPSGSGAITPILAEAIGCPTVGTITNPYGYNIPNQPDISYYQCDLDLSGCHSGIDIENGRGTSVSAVFDGEATVIDSDGTKGKYITISNPKTGYSATFEHLDSQIVSLNEKVNRGQVIGTMGATGAVTGVHLHYRLEKNGKIVNPFRYLGPSASIESISLIQSDIVRENNYQSKPSVFNWGRCNSVP